jgi:hypothetical protein
MIMHLRETGVRPSFGFDVIAHAALFRKASALLVVYKMHYC